MDKTIQKAGAIIVSKSDENKIVLLHSGKQNDWSFPKGHIEEGEDPTGAMIREIKEETGLLVESYANYRIYIIRPPMGALFQ